MKSVFLRIALGLSLACISNITYAQQNASVGCMDASIRLQSQEIKQHFLKQGFEVYKDAMISMSSMEPYPVIVDLQKGMFYQIIFVGNVGDSKMKMEVYDGHDTKLDEKLVMRNRDQNNFISYSFTPEQSDTYMFLLLQKMKAKDMCGSFTILKLKGDQKNATVQPFEAPPAK